MLGRTKGGKGGHRTTTVRVIVLVNYRCRERLASVIHEYSQECLSCPVTEVVPRY